MNDLSAEPKKLLERCRNMLCTSTGIQEKIAAVHALGRVQDRAAYSVLMEILEKENREKGNKEEGNEELAAHAILALAQIKDSRVLFPVINYANLKESPLIRQRVLQYICYTKDPRAEAFLEEYLQGSGKPFQDIAEKAMGECRGNPEFSYRYNGSDEDCHEASRAQGQVKVSGKGLASINDIMEEYKKPDFTRPQTYIINLQGEMFVGGHLQEHVQVARGQDVLAAGEVTFKEEDNLWKVESINYRSCGYYPDKSSFFWVKKFFKNSDVRLEKNAFDEKFPRLGYNDPDFLSTMKFGRYFTNGCPAEISKSS